MSSNNSSASRLRSNNLDSATILTTLEMSDLAYDDYGLDNTLERPEDEPRELTLLPDRMVGGTMISISNVIDPKTLEIGAC
jgi:hypothetical protein